MHWIHTEDAGISAPCPSTGVIINDFKVLLYATVRNHQKLAIKGDVTGVVVTPVTSPPASQHAASPAASSEATALPAAASPVSSVS